MINSLFKLKNEIFYNTLYLFFTSGFQPLIFYISYKSIILIIGYINI